MPGWPHRAEGLPYLTAKNRVHGRNAGTASTQCSLRRGRRKHCIRIKPQERSDHCVEHIGDQGAVVPELPPPLDCDAESMEPAELATCKTAAAANVAFSTAYLARFRSFYRIDASGVSVHEKGALVRVSGARVAVKKTGKGHRLEATFPSSALPRTLQAPLRDCYVYASAAFGQTPPALPLDLLNRRHHGILSFS